MFFEVNGIPFFRPPCLLLMQLVPRAAVRSLTHAYPMRILRLMSRGSFGTKEKCEIHVWARVFEVTLSLLEYTANGSRFLAQICISSSFFI